MATRASVSGLVITLNEEERLAACLASLAFCDELIVIDSGSTDNTVRIAEAAGARVVERAFVGMNDQKDFGRQQCSSAWVFNLDADEVASAELVSEVEQLLVRDASELSAGYEIPFRNHFADRWVRGCGYYPDRHVRLVQRERATWNAQELAHDRVEFQGRVGRLSGHIDHYSFDSVQDFLRKSERYAEYFAQRAVTEGRSAGPLTIATHSSWRFFRSFVLQAGFRDGSLGLVISGLQAYEVFQKYARLWERTKRS